MKFSIQKKELHQALKEVQPAVAARSPLPICAGVWVEAAAGRLDLQTTDLDLMIRLQVAASTSPDATETPALVVGAKALANAVSAMPGPEIVAETSQEEGRLSLVISSESKQVVLEQTFAAGDWPSMGEGIRWSPLSRFDRTELADALARVVLSASEDPVRPVLTGVQINFDRDVSIAELAATDSYRLGLVSVDVEMTGVIPERSPTVPARALKALAKKLARDGGDVEAYLGQAAPEGEPSLIEFCFGSASWVVRLVEGEFPDWRRLVPAEEGGLFVYEARELRGAVKDAASLASSRAVPVRVDLGERCRIAMAESETARYEQVLAGAAFTPDGAGPMEVWLNATFLTDGVRFTDDVNRSNGEATGRMWVREPLKPVLFTGGRSRYLLMPIRRG